MAKKRNIIVGQSGGPTAAINSSLAGVYRTAKDRGANKVYGMLFGIQGLLQERYIDLSEYITNDLDTELLKRTPAAFLGSCRYKLPEIHENKDVYEKIFSILEKLDIEAFIYIGGNDSMDTIKKLSDYAIVNLVDGDMIYGHRRDIAGYAGALTRFDEQLGEFLANMRDDDMLMITADHGCDPGYTGTDHTREYVPCLIYGKEIKAGVNLHTRKGFADMAATIAEALGSKYQGDGESFWDEIRN